MNGFLIDTTICGFNLSLNRQKEKKIWKRQNLAQVKAKKEKKEL